MLAATRVASVAVAGANVDTALAIESQSARSVARSASCYSVHVSPRVAHASLQDWSEPLATQPSVNGGKALPSFGPSTYRDSAVSGWQ